MSVTSIPTAAFRYTADGAQAVAETIRVREAVEALNDSPLDELIGQFNDLDLSIEGIGEKVAGFASAGALLGLVKQGADFVNEIGDAAERAGTTAEALSKLKFAADQSDVSFDALVVGIREFQDGLSEAAIGSGTVASTLNELGISFEKLRGQDIEQQIQEIADAFADVKDQTDRVRISQELFGKGGKELILLLGQGGEGIREFNKLARQLGLVLDNRATAAVDRGTKALQRFTDALLGAGVQVAQQIALTFTDSGDEILETQAKIKSLQRDVLAQQNEFNLTGTDSARFRLRASQQDLAVEKEKLRVLQEQKQAKESTFGIFAAPNLGGLPDLPSIDDGSDARRAAEKAAEEMRRQDERLRDDMIDQQEDLNRLFAEEQKRREKEVSDNLDEEVRRRNEIEQNARDQNVQREIAFQEQILAIRKQGVASAQILLTAYGGRFAALAKAILLVEKVNAIKSTFINTREAVMKTFAKYGATPIGYAAAAAVAVLGAAQIAAIAAQGSSGSGSGGNIGGAPRGDGQPGFDPVTNPSQPFVNNAPQTATQIIIQGPVFSSRETADFIIQQIREAVDKRDVVIIGSGSRQAQEIMNS